MNAEATEVKEFYEQWYKDFSPMYYIEYDSENGPAMQKAKMINPRMIWTAHGTCENDQVSAGFMFFGDPPRCCWTTYGWYVSQKAWREEMSVETAYYTWCDQCNPEGENDEGNADCKECEGEGHVNYFFD